MSVAHEVFTPNPNPPTSADLDVALAPMPTVRAIFSDIDGTIVHYDSKLMPAQGYELLRSTMDGSDDAEFGVREATYFFHKPTGVEVKCWRVPSLTLGGGYISARTLELIDTLRNEFGVAFILMTGARTSTFLMRRASRTLPSTVFDVCEGGGKMWRRDPSSSSADNAQHDAEWSARFEPMCGPVGQLESDPLLRKGKLWDIYRTLHAEGYHLDGKSFSTSFLVDLAKSRVCHQTEAGGGRRSVDEVEEHMKQRFANGEFDMVDAEGARNEAGDKQTIGSHSFWYVTNLGKGQVCANGSGKHAAMQYIFDKLGIDGSTSVALFDDENDLEFAEMCGAGFVPSVAHGTVVPAIEGRNHMSGRPSFLRTPIDGPLGTDMALEAVLRKLRSAHH